MPRFLDYHEKMPQLPPEAVQQMSQMVKSGQSDEFGVKPVNVFMSTGGQAWCLTDAPNADSVCKSHEAKGFQLSRGDVYEVNSLA